MDYEDIRVETRGPSNWIFLNRPGQMNAVRPQTHPELAHAFEQADADPDTSFIVLTARAVASAPATTSRRFSTPKTAQANVLRAC